MQLVAYGAQDIYLTGNPLITYFKVVYRRHTNFAMESIAQVFNGAVEFGRSVTALISRNGDLISGMTLQATLPAVTGKLYCHNVGHYLIKEVSVEIGGQTIDKHYADWLDVWAQLTVPAGQMLGYRKMIGEGVASAGGAASGLQTNNVGGTVYVPLQFWFCRNVGLALPLIALQYHEVKVNMTFNAASVLHNAATAVTGLDATLYVDYIYLDTDERRRFAQVSHEYLIEQLQTYDQTVANGATSANVDLNLNHPVKELIWTVKSNDSLTGLTGQTGGTRFEPSATSLNSDSPVCYDNATGWFIAAGAVASAKIQLNGQDRFQERKGGHFNLEQPKKHHTNVPLNANIYVYSFALKPEEHQPSGTCNFSRIDNARLIVTLTGVTVAGVIKVYATNYNVLRIMSGMGGLAYSN